MPQKYLTIGDLATLVHHRGPTTLPGSPPNTENGATMLCLHDAGGNGNQFTDLMDHLADGNSPLSYDQPGHGRSAGLDSLGSVSAMVGHLSELSEAWAIESPVLIGEGMGAAVALQAAADRPGWAQALVLIGAVAPRFALDDEIERLSAITSGKARREFDRSGYAPDTDRPIYHKAFAEWVRTDPRATLGDRKGQAAWTCPDGLDVPTLIVIGEHQDEDERTEAEALAAALGNATVAQLDGAGRRGVIEQPDALATAIASFVASNGGGS